MIFVSFLRIVFFFMKTPKICIYHENSMENLNANEKNLQRDNNFR